MSRRIPFIGLWVQKVGSRGVTWGEGLARTIYVFCINMGVLGGHIYDTHTFFQHEFELRSSHLCISSRCFFVLGTGRSYFLLLAGIHVFNATISIQMYEQQLNKYSECFLSTKQYTHISITPLLDYPRPTPSLHTLHIATLSPNPKQPRNLCCRLRNRARRRRRLGNVIRACPRNRRLRWSLCDKTRTSRRNLLRTTQAQANIDPAGQREVNVDLAFAHREFSGAGYIVEGVGRHGVVVCVVGAIAG
jgi:hypothetical protein